MEKNSTQLIRRISHHEADNNTESRTIVVTKDRIDFETCLKCRSMYRFVQSIVSKRGQMDDEIDDRCISYFGLVSVLSVQSARQKANQSQIERKGKRRDFIIRKLQKHFSANVTEYTYSTELRMKPEPEVVVSRATLERACAFHQPAGSVDIRSGTHVPRLYRARAFILPH